MLSRINILVITLLFLFNNAGLHAQDNDYLKHRKFFDICSIKKQCSECYTCNQLRFITRINNKTDKKIKNVYYKFYSPVFNKIVEKEAKIEGERIDAKHIGIIYTCVLDGQHWIISKIVYADESSETFVLHDRMENYVQEPDECDCNE